MTTTVPGRWPNVRTLCLRVSSSSRVHTSPVHKSPCASHNSAARSKLLARWVQDLGRNERGHAKSPCRVTVVSRRTTKPKAQVLVWKAVMLFSNQSPFVASFGLALLCSSIALVSEETSGEKKLLNTGKKLENAASRTTADTRRTELKSHFCL